MPGVNLCLWLVGLCFVIALAGTTTLDQGTPSDGPPSVPAPGTTSTLETVKENLPEPVTTELPNAATNCPGCVEKKRKQEEILSAAELRKLKIKFIKQQILDKLNLRSRPNVNVSKFALPDILFKTEVLGGDERLPKDAEDKDDYDTTKKIVLFPSNINSNYSCNSENSNGSRCFNFQLSSRSFHGGVTSAKLFFYKNGSLQNNQSLVITEIVSAGKNGTKKERILEVDDEPTRTGWLKFEMRTTLQRWVLKPHLKHSFQITCKGKGCAALALPVSTEERHKPFLVISTGPVLKVSRKRRETVCTGTSTRCCKESLTITFEEIGWSNWIIHPLNFTANYCRGTCDSELGISRYHHTSIMQRYIESLRSRNLETTLSLCCSPSRMSSMSFIYLNQDNTIQKAEFNDMIVQACECS